MLKSEQIELLWNFVDFWKFVDLWKFVDFFMETC